MKFLQLVLFVAIARTIPAAISLDEEQKTIPCRGVEDGNYRIDPDGFATVPLSARPNLGKILQHGFQPSRNQATMPTLERSLSSNVQISQGFSDFRIRSFPSDAACSYVQCERTSTEGSMNSGVGDYSQMDFARLMQYQVMLESGVNSLASRYSRRYEAFNHPSWTSWTQQMLEFIGTNRNCSLDGLRFEHRHNELFICTVQTECQVFEEAFLQDLAELPTSDTFQEANLPAYETFFEKWGYGLVEEFQLGSADVVLTNKDWFISSSEDIILYMGRSGGGGNYLDSFYDDQYYDYTDDDCLDPAPVEVSYREWSWLLSDSDFALPEQLQLDRRKLANNLSWMIGALVPTVDLRTALEQMGLFPEVTESNCIPNATHAPTSVPTLEPTTVATLSPTESPTEAPNQGSQAPTSVPGEPSLPPTNGDGEATSSSPSLSPSMNAETAAPSQAPSTLAPSIAPSSTPSLEDSQPSQSSSANELSPRSIEQAVFGMGVAILILFDLLV